MRVAWVPPVRISKRTTFIWLTVVLMFGALLMAAIHFVFGAWAWSAAAFFAVAAAMCAYFGLTACGPWTETPLLEMLRAANRPYFGGGAAIARHFAFLTL